MIVFYVPSGLETHYKSHNMVTNVTEKPFGFQVSIEENLLLVLKGLADSLYSFCSKSWWNLVNNSLG